MRFGIDVYRRVFSELTIPQGGRILLLPHSTEIAGILSELLPDAEVDFLKDIGEDILISDNDVRLLGFYDYVVDNGVLEQSGWNEKIVRGIGLHLKCVGGMLIFTDTWENVMTANTVLFSNWFGEVVLLEKVPTSFWGTEDGNVYVLRADSYNGQAAWLQSYFSYDTRKMLSTLLTRMEFDIDAQANRERVIALCRQKNIPTSYLKSFITSVSEDADKLFNLLGMRG